MYHNVIFTDIMAFNECKMTHALAQECTTLKVSMDFPALTHLLNLVIDW